MKCIKCDYPLWNLREPRCPECGESFDVRDWRYNSKHVAFLCTHCQQKLGPYKPGPIDKNCPGCDQLIDWSSVAVVPLIDDASLISMRKPIHQIKPKFSFAVLFVALFLAVGGFMILIPISMLTNPPTLIPPIIGIIVGSIVALIGIDSARKEYRAMNCVIWISLLIIWSVWMVTNLVR